MVVVLILLGVEGGYGVLREECLQLVDVGEGTLQVVLQLLLLLDQAAHLSGLRVECLQIDPLLALDDLLQLGGESLVSLGHARQTQRIEVNETLLFLIYYNLQTINVLFEELQLSGLALHGIRVFRLMLLVDLLEEEDARVELGSLFIGFLKSRHQVVVVFSQLVYHCLRG
jgi:hypothetical protein